MPRNVTELNVAFLDYSFPTMMAELGEVPDMFKETGKDQHFGDLPVYVIANGLQYKPTYGLNSRVPAEELAAADRTHRELQTELLLLSTNSLLLEANASGHNINFEQPQIVIEAVETLLEAL